MPSISTLRLFITSLFSWYARHKRSLPWRDLDGEDPVHRLYLVLVSEVMLQQTQLPRVRDMYKKFIREFPRAQVLSDASNADVLRAWRGLGYNSRALRLRDAAHILHTRGATFVTSTDVLRTLPGVGPYTAGALQTFALGRPTPCIDTNIRRILHRCFFGPERRDGTMKVGDDRLLDILSHMMAEVTPIYQQCQHEIPGSPSFPWLSSNEHLVAQAGSELLAALMDFGSMVLTASIVDWAIFPKEMIPVCKSYGKRIVRIRKLINNEPGRIVAGRLIPQRIFRGRIIEALRDVPDCLDLMSLGSTITPDWNPGLIPWLTAVLRKLEKDGLIEFANDCIRLKK